MTGFFDQLENADLVGTTRGKMEQQFPIKPGQARGIALTSFSSFQNSLHKQNLLKRN